MDKIFGGIVIGVSSGIILSLFLWIKDLIVSCNERGEQIRHLSGLWVEYRQMIYDADDLHVPTMGKPFRKNDMQKAYFDCMQKDVQSILDGRSSRLSFDEIAAVRAVFLFYTDFFPTVTLNEKGYDQIFDKLESLKWLKLPPRER